MQLERDLEKYLRDGVKRLKGKYLKQTGESGIPDRLILLPGGVSCFVELKREGCKPRKLQLIQIRKLQWLGQRAEYVDTKAQADALLKRLTA